MSPALFDEDDLLPLSAIADFEFCPRRAALHLLEQQWEENRATAEGTLLHERAHSQEESETRGDLLIARSLPIRSLTLGLSGKCDVVEFRRGETGARLPRRQGLWQPLPIEYKRGRVQHQESFRLQLCAQSICLEEHFGVTIPAGVLFYGKSHRRVDVDFSDGLRAKTTELVRQLHHMVRSKRTPPAIYQRKCDKCSLFETCMPKSIRANHSAAAHTRRQLAAMLATEEEVP
ncbi:MAG: CRISPR-associated protein Cas4 [Sumerlaeia bacterium]